MGKNQGPQSNNSTHSIEVCGGCHCQAVRFVARVPADSVLLHCNCSVCSMTGFVHLLARHDEFTLLSGRDQLSSYRFNTRQANHLFCNQCGVKSFYQPRSHPDCWSINAHCLDKYAASDWVHQNFDGQNWEQAKSQLDNQESNT
jgi:hypothetical protein